MKKTGKVIKNLAFAMFVSLGLFGLCSTNVSAAELPLDSENVSIEIETQENDGTIDFDNITNYNVSTYIPFDTGISLYGTSKPSSTWNLSTQGRYNFEGNSVYHVLYSNYKFTGVTSVKVVVSVDEYTDYFEGFTGTVDLYKDGLIDTKVSTWDCADGMTTTATITGLKSGSDYYLKFHNPLVFSGYIQKAN